MLCQLVLLGAEEGLFAMNPQSPMTSDKVLIPLTGISNIHQMTLAAGLGMIIMIVGQYCSNYCAQHNRCGRTCVIILICVHLHKVIVALRWCNLHTVTLTMTVIALRALSASGR